MTCRLRPDPEGVIRALRSIGFASVATDGDCDVEQMAGQPLHVVQRRHVHAPLEIDVRAAHLWQADSRGRYAVRAQDVRVGLMSAPAANAFSLPVRTAQCCVGSAPSPRSEEHTSELQSLMRISYAVFCLKTKTTTQ